MAKRERADNDATMEVSTSQLVPDALPRPRVPDAAPAGRGPRAGASPSTSPNDASVWKQVVVGSDDFAPPAKPRTGRGRRLAIGVGVAVAILGAGAGAWYVLRGGEEAPGPATTPAAAPAKPTADPAPPAPAPPAPAVAASAASETPAEPASTEPSPGDLAAADAAPPPRWLEELASSLGLEPPPDTWLRDLLLAFTSVYAAPAPAPGKAPAAPGKRAAVAPAPKKPALAPKKPAAKKPAPVPPKRR